MGGVRVGVVGATGAVGREILSILEERHFPLASLRLWASPASAGCEIPFAGEGIRVEAFDSRALAGLDIALVSAGAAVSRELRRTAPAGVRVVDNSSAFRMDEGTPLVVPEINGGDLEPGHRWVANPNCTTAIVLVVLAPLHRAYGLESAVVATYQAASGAGARGLFELEEGVRGNLAGAEPEASVFPAPLAFNAIPAIGEEDGGGGTGEELKLEREGRKILGLAGLRIAATCVRVPVRRSHSAAVAAWFRHPPGAEDARRVLASAPGVLLHPLPTPRAAEGADPVLVGRLRTPHGAGGPLSLFVSGDQLRKGAALNAVQIAELMLPWLPA